MADPTRITVDGNEAAASVGISRALAAFHLDRLVKDGLLIPEYRRLSGRTGPGAGRPAKLYRRAPREACADRHAAAEGLADPTDGQELARLPAGAGEVDGHGAGGVAVFQLRQFLALAQPHR